MDGCVLCREITGADTPLAYTGDLVVIFPARYQPAANRGSVLLATRHHIETLYDITDDHAGTLMRAVRDTARVVQDVFAADGTTIAQSNHPPGQEVPHLHFHIRPRHHGDYYPTAIEQVPEGERVAMAARLRPHLAAVLDLAEPPNTARFAP
jgi:histidine triad (HIT) family protein